MATSQKTIYENIFKYLIDFMILRKPYSVAWFSIYFVYLINCRLANLGLTYLTNYQS